MEKWALITGASSGFGIDYAHILAQKGYSLIITARRAERLEKLKEEVKQRYSVNVHCISSDLTEPNAAQRLYNKTQELGIKVDVLVNNAGFGIFGKFDQMTTQESHNMIQLNISSVTELCHLYIQDMKELREGHILLVASLVGYMPTPLYSVYAATKAYIVSFGQALAAEMKPLNIYVNTLSPGMTKTEFMDVSGQKLTAFENAIMMESMPVARKAIKELFNKKTTTLPGFIYFFMKLCVSFVPNKILATFTYKLMKGKC